MSTQSDCSHQIKAQFWGGDNVEKVAIQAKSWKTANREAKFIRRQNKKVGLDIVKVDLHIYLRLVEVGLPYSELPILGKEWYYKLLTFLIIPYREKRLKINEKNSSPSNPIVNVYKMALC